MFPAQSDLVVTPAVKPTPVFVAKEMNKYNISIDEILEVTKNYCLKILMPKNTYNNTGFFILSFPIKKQIYKYFNVT